MTIYIVVLHYGDNKNTLNCLESVAKLRKKGIVTKIILVDNNFTSEEPWLLRLRRISLSPSEVVIIRNSSNLGFAAGVNKGVKKALKDDKTSCILILNNDTIVSPNLLGQLLKTPADIVSPVIKYKTKTGKYRYDYGGKINWWTGRTRHIEKSSKFKVQSSKLWKDIDYLSGCCMLVKKAVFEKIGLFDERFFMYFEDADFCTRAKRAGLDIKVNPKTVVYHTLAASIGRKSNKAIIHNLRGNFIFINRHLGWKRPVGYLYLFLLSMKIIFNMIIYVFTKPSTFEEFLTG